MMVNSFSLSLDSDGSLTLRVDKSGGSGSLGLTGSETRCQVEIDPPDLRALGERLSSVLADLGPEAADNDGCGPLLAAHVRIVIGTAVMDAVVEAGVVITTQVASVTQWLATITDHAHAALRRLHDGDQAAGLVGK